MTTKFENGDCLHYEDRNWSTVLAATFVGVFLFHYENRSAGLTNVLRFSQQQFSVVTIFVALMVLWLRSSQLCFALIATFVEPAARGLAVCFGALQYWLTTRLVGVFLFRYDLRSCGSALATNFVDAVRCRLLRARQIAACFAGLQKVVQYG